MVYLNRVIFAVCYNMNTMKKRTLIILIGIWIALIPTLGLPNTWKNRVVSVSALLVVYLAYTRNTPSKPIQG